MRKHKFKSQMHCSDCFQTAAKKVLDYIGSPEQIEKEREDLLVKEWAVRKYGGFARMIYEDEEAGKNELQAMKDEGTRVEGYALYTTSKGFGDTTPATDEELRCAWCHKTVAEIGRGNLDAHLQEHDDEDVKVE